MTPYFKIELITNEKNFLALKDEWNSLLKDSSADNIFLTWEWISAWWNCFKHDQQLWIVVLRSTGSSKQLLGLAPLLLHKSSLIPGKLPSHRELAFIGANEIAPDHLDFIIRNGYEEKVLAAILKYIQSDKTWDILRLDALASNSSLAKHFLKHANSLSVHIDPSKGYILRLPDSWPKYQSGLGKNLRKNLKRYSRQLENDYPGQVVLSYASNEHEIKEALQFLFEQASNNLQEQGKRYSLNVEKLQDFHFRIANSLFLQNWVRIYLIVIGKEYISVLYCFRYNNTISDYQTTFNSSWKNYRPGQLILAHSIEQAIKEKIQVYDFLRGEHPYLDQWTNETTIDYYIKMGNTLKGRMLVFLYTVLQVRFWIYDLRDKFLKRTS